LSISSGSNSTVAIIVVVVLIVVAVVVAVVVVVVVWCLLYKYSCVGKGSGGGSSAALLFRRLWRGLCVAVSALLSATQFATPLHTNMKDALRQLYTTHVSLQYLQQK
jgi:hypothetical protein